MCSIEDNKISVFVIDNHPAFVWGLRSAFWRRRQLRLCGAAQSLEDAAGLVACCKPEVVLVELLLPTMGGIAAARSLLAAHPNLRILLFSDCARAEELREARRVGVSGFVSKTSTINELVRAIVQAHEGGAVFDYSNEDLARQVRVSPRERETLALMCRGLTTKEIASAMSLSPRTIDSYRKTLMVKARVRNAVALGRFAVQNGYADAPAPRA